MVHRTGVTFKNRARSDDHVTFLIILRSSSDRLESLDSVKLDIGHPDHVCFYKWFYLRKENHLNMLHDFNRILNTEEKHYYRAVVETC